MLLLTTDFAQEYTELFNIIFTYATPFFKLAFMIFGAVYGVSALSGMAWIVDQVRKDAEELNKEDEKRGK